ncbi:hypothetical protein ACFO5Q_12000 [Kordiimonas lipolytica]|uniref:Uncharacterized protein n=1 Tax=Kordiimonas lipolytica TaxID=1662421 RepID=A0ABV8UCM8_9PROT|nr:hypothetical protein [Kordiimonas lipolytica]
MASFFKWLAAAFGLNVLMTTISVIINEELFSFGAQYDYLVIGAFPAISSASIWKKDYVAALLSFVPNVFLSFGLILGEVCMFYGRCL